MSASVTVEHLGNPQTESVLRERLQNLFEEFDGHWSVSVLGAQDNSVWELKITPPENGNTMRIKKLDGVTGGSRIDLIVSEARHVVESYLRDRQNSGSKGGV